MAFASPNSNPKTKNQAGQYEGYKTSSLWQSHTVLPSATIYEDSQTENGDLDVDSDEDQNYGWKASNHMTAILQSKTKRALSSREEKKTKLPNKDEQIVSELFNALQYA